MKKVICNNCNGSWYLDDSLVEKQSFCLYCGAPLYEQNEVVDYTTLGLAIYGALKKMGIDSLEAPGKISSFIMDVSPGLRKEAKIFSRSFNKEYGSLAKKAFQEDASDSIQIFKSLGSLLISEEGLSEEWAGTICNALSEACLYWHSQGDKIRNFSVENHEAETNMSQKLISVSSDPTTDLMTYNTVSASDTEYQQAIKEWEKHRPLSKSERHIEEVKQAKETCSKGFKKQALDMFIKIADQGYTDVYMDIADIYSFFGDRSSARKWKNKALNDAMSREKAENGPSIM